MFDQNISSFFFNFTNFFKTLNNSTNCVAILRKLRSDPSSGALLAGWAWLAEWFPLAVGLYTATNALVVREPFGTARPQSL